MKRKRKHPEFYLRKYSYEKCGTYLGKDREETKRVYMQKSYYGEVLKHVDKEIAVLEKFTSKYENCTEQIRNEYSLMSDDLKSYLDPIDLNDADFVRWWQNVPFTPKPIDADIYLMISDRGERVRSKSELNIANMLNKMNIPYRYECPLKLFDGRIIYPDFTALNVRKRLVYYWEHRGMMDSEVYSNSSVIRIKDLEKTGIFPGRELIITEETKELQLGTEEIELLIREYLL